MRTEGTKGALRAIFGSVVGGIHSGRSRFGTAVAVVIAIAPIPTKGGIFCSCTCSTSSVGIGTKFVYELAVILQQFINLRLLFVNLCLLFSDDLLKVVRKKQSQINKQKTKIEELLKQNNQLINKLGTNTNTGGATSAEAENTHCGR